MRTQPSSSVFPAGTPKERASAVYDRLYLCFLAFITFAGFLNTTMFPFRIRSRQLLFVSIFLAALVLAGFFLFKKERWTRSRIAALLVCVCMIISWAKVRHGYLLELALLIAGACGISFLRIAGTYLAVSVPFMAITIAMALTGHIQNLVYYQEERGGAARIAFGIHYPTDFCAHLFFLICCWLWIRGEKASRLEGALLLPAAWFCMRFCGARTTALCLVFLYAALFAGRALSLLAVRTDVPQDGTHPLFRIPSLLLLLAVPGSCLLSVLLTWLYNPEIRWMKRLNDLLTDRLRLGRVGMDRYPVNLFGHVVKTQGSGGSTANAQDYFFLDSSYVYILLNLGLLTLLAVMFILCRAAWKAYRQQRWEQLCILAAICLACFMEQHLISIGYHPFLLLLLAEAVPGRRDAAAASVTAPPSRGTPAPY